MLDGARAAVDRWQQRHRVLAFPVAVAKKFGEDGAGRLAALVAYYSFFAIFPLLLVLTTVLGVSLQNNPDLQQDVLDSALSQFPVIGDQLEDDIGSLDATGIALLVGLIGAFIGARGMAAAMQEAANSVWDVPYVVRPGFPWSLLRSLALLVVVGVGLVGTTLVTGFMTGLVDDLGVVARAGGYLLSTVLNVGVFLLSFRLATSKEIPTRALVLGAVMAAVGWTALQVLGGYLVTRQVSSATDVYGFFAIVIGLLWFLYVAALIALYALEADVVRERGLWPRSLLSPALTDADKAALTDHALAEKRVDEQTIDVAFSRKDGP